METLYIGTNYSYSDYVPYSNVGTVTKGPYLHSSSNLRGMSLSLGSFVKETGGDAKCYYTLSGTPTEAGEISIHIMLEYNQLTNGEAVVGDGTPGTYSYMVYEKSSDVKVLSIVIPEPDTLYTNDSITLTARTVPDTASNSDVIWSVTSGSDLVTASQSGKSFTLTAGSTTGWISVECVAADGGGASNSRSIAVCTPYYYYLYFNANGGSGAPSTMTARGPDTLNAVSFKVPSTTPTRSGYRFLGWNKSSTATEATVDPGDTYKVSYPSATLYAVWHKNQEYWYTYLEYDANGGSGAPETQESSVYQATKPTGKTSFVIPEDVPTRTGKTFIGWDQRTDYRASIRPGATIWVPRAETTTLYATWSMVVTLDANGGTFPDGNAAYKLNYNAEVLAPINYLLTYEPCLDSAPTPTRAAETSESEGGFTITKFKFLGWFTAPTGGTQVEAWDIRPRDCNDQTLYAQYTAGESSEVESGGDGAATDPTTRKGFSILISDNTGSAFYTLLGNVTSNGKSYFYNCISSLSITGGPEDPFEYLTISVPKKRLESVASELVEANGILAGVTKIQLDCMGRGMFTVTKCRYSGRRYTITAYCDAERFRGVTNEKILTGAPWTILMEILGARSEYGISIAYLDTEDLYDAGVSTRCTIPVTFAKDTNLWYIMQVCAMLCRCRIWFSDDTIHIRDCTRAVHDRIYEGAETVDLYPESESNPMYARVVGDVDLGDEGADTVVNSVTIRSANTTGTMANIGPLYGDGTTTKPTDGSVEKFGERTEQLSVPELTWNYDVEEGETVTEETERVSAAASVFAQNYIGYLSEPQQSIEFTVKEMQETSDGSGYEWLSYFDDPSMAVEITDIPDEVHLSSESVCGQGTLPQKLMLSSRTRHYPNCTTTYTFGQMKSISLSDSTSRIMDALNKG